MKPKWLEIAEKELGVHEISGPKANARIIEYGQATILKPTSDEVPWCSDFVNWCIREARKTHPEIDEETHSAAAMSWADWGKNLGEYPQEGCVIVFEWDGGGHHVCFYTDAVNDDHIKCLGGNQGDSVKVSVFPVANVIEYRWPNNYEEG